MFLSCSAKVESLATNLIEWVGVVDGHGIGILREGTVGLH